MDSTAIQAVKDISLFTGLTPEQFDCIATGEVVELAAGDVPIREGEKTGYFYVTLGGEIQLWRSYDRQDVLMATSKRGDFSGEIAILLDSPWLATARVSKPARIFRLNEEGFWKMLACCPSVTRKILSAVALRFRNIEGFASQREKLVSLGTMAAGLAHELNNPASAAMRAASYLQKVTDNSQTYLCELTCLSTDIDWEHLLKTSGDAMERLQKGTPLESVERSDREDAVATWLEQHQIADSWDLAGTFVEAGLDVAWLDALIAKLPPESHTMAVQWIESRLHLKILLKQIETSTGRVSELVKAVKSYTHMDKTSMQEIDIHEGIESTLTMLGYKLKSMTVKRAFDRTLPRIMAHGGELNQVWTNLIDNAIDAVGGTGKLCIGTFREGDHLVVEIVDNGAGIPQDIQSHMFEPFFTTKPIGSGTGLGLIISNRIVADGHGGEIEFESKPGETRFKVRLPYNRKAVRPTVEAK